jgi:hypothetical protein
MVNLYNQNEKITLCADKNCVTVFGETARFLNAVIVILAVIFALVLVYNFFR